MHCSSLYISNSNWNNTFPIVDSPFQGESLLGYLLRLDYLNDYKPGTIINNTYKDHSSLKSFSGTLARMCMHGNIHI